MKYLNQNSDLTLREGLKEYTTSYKFLNKNDGHDDASQWFRNHDVTHVIFGTRPFELRGESLNDIWTLFGSNMKFKEYLEFFKITGVSYKTVMKGYKKHYGSMFMVYLMMFAYIPDILLTIYRSFKMSKEWNWHSHEEYFDIPLKDLRKEFNIKVFRP
jgi:hypothetical protein